ncbi:MULTISPECIES: tetratricopeptide repeat protein [unclassified Roseobacter]|uniref:tetratricopeptide repeat protein n=1 Tax=unclassified Roseobacter TaxID=196798 RepID=UPI00209C6992|nr:MULTISPECIES: tetratricopeptide repeat protein [unclassified Roseobacter]
MSTTLMSFLSGGALADVSAGLIKLDEGDLPGAATDFANAFDAGDAEGAFYLGRLFELGLGTDKNEVQAANLYSAAADAGSAKAKLRLGLIYHEGRILLRDYVAGTQLICDAADAGEPDAQLNCALAYQQGIGIDANEEQAIAYLNTAVANDNIAAMNVLSSIYRSRGDTERAKVFALEAADRGNALGMLRYAEMVSQEDPPDLITAYAYASLAFVRGLSEAGELQNRLEGQMTRENVLAGQQQAVSWTNAQIQKMAN